MPRGTRASGIRAARSRSTECPRIVAHRGASGVAPENTMAAFAEALRAGADAIELDLQLTRDGVPVVYHDRTLAKIGARGSIRTRTLAELRALDFGRWFAPRFTGERIPTLADVIARFADRLELWLELKPDGEPPSRVRALVEAVVAEVRGRARVLCFDARVLRVVARVAPELARVRNIDVRPRDGELARELAGAGALCLPARLVDAALARAVHARGCELFVYRCDTPRNLTRALRASVDGIIGDRPDWLRAELARA
ncbi:MAG TPA: glycerophosphodiester phosphodiesterase family protein [Nannocystaceae bacterium]|nr:glycerophosphodiester phosphodiesterase family protein [Nannocystaceae bacterium]